MSNKKKRNSIEIRDKVIEPFYIQQDSRQFSVIKEGSINAEGYFTTLSAALQFISKNHLLNNNPGTQLSIRDYIDQYEEQNTNILDTLDI